MRTLVAGRLINERPPSDRAPRTLIMTVVVTHPRVEFVVMQMVVPVSTHMPVVTCVAM